MALKALYAVAADCDGAVADPRALLPVVGRPLLAYQVERAAAVGAQCHFILASAASARIDRMIDGWRAIGIDARRISSVADIAPHISATDRLLVVGDGVLPDQQLMARIADAHTLRVALVIDTAEVAAFERVDINHRWAGLANVGVAEVRKVAELPADWSGDSALMRQALQHGAGTETVRAADVAAGRLALPVTVDGAAALTAQLLAGQAGGSGDPAERLLVRPLAGVAVGALLGNVAAARSGWLAGAVLAIVGLVFAGFGLAGGAGLAVLLAMTAGEVERQVAPFQPQSVWRRWGDKARLALLLPILPVLAWSRPGGDGPVVLLTALLLLLLCITAEAAASRRGRLAWAPGAASAAALVTGAALAGLFSAGLWAALFMLAGSALAEVLAVPAAPDSNAPRA